MESKPVRKSVKRPRVSMPEQDPRERVRNFREVPFGYTPQMAIEEAERCLACKNRECVAGCPVEVDIPLMIRLVAEGKFLEAYRVVRETNSLPAVCGRVCPQEEQCEIKCILGRKAEPVAIGRLERFVADYALERGATELPQPRPRPGRVAIVGSGPAGLTAAGDLIKLGYQVTIFEALHAPGGVLMYGIPEFRLPKATVRAEVDLLKAMGVRLELDVVVGRTITVDELMGDGYQAAFLGTGAGLPSFMNIPGETLNGVYSANEFLTRTNLMKAYLFPQHDTPIKVGRRVAVVGGGNVAMDAVRCAIRLGAEEGIIVYRRSETEMPARKEEIHHAADEGVIFRTLTNPVRILGGQGGWVKSLECVRMELGEPDASGRRRPIPVPGSEFSWEVDTVVMALGTSPNPIIHQTTPGLSTNRWGCIVAEEATGLTSRPGVYAGGDAVTGAATVILAMGAGKRAAAAIHRQLENL
ncbi:MAG TPA: glutamate synthase (NADPH), homotetrameric [Clostridiales bacterium]|nr:glutamate synthase (NADPH), homotetrameric [Clostridiales bacterium]